MSSQKCTYCEGAVSFAMAACPACGAIKKIKYGQVVFTRQIPASIREVQRASERLYGILYGIAADYEITDKEIAGLNEWLGFYEFLHGKEPFKSIVTLLLRSLEDLHSLLAKGTPSMTPRAPTKRGVRLSRLYRYAYRLSKHSRPFPHQKERTVLPVQSSSTSLNQTRRVQGLMVLGTTLCPKTGLFVS